MKRTTHSASLGLVALLAIATISGAADDITSADLTFFENEVRPVLATRCQGCHGPEKVKANLRLDSRAAILSGGDSGPAIVPGKPGESLLVDAINHGDLVKMPPKSKLPDAEIAALTKWVERGAPWPSGDAPKASAAKPGSGIDFVERASKQWSFRPVRDSASPIVSKADWPIGPVDRFLLARLEKEGLSPAPDADRGTLIRRLSFDLIGLPPTAEEIRSFVDDKNPDAYEKLVDRLLASPHYGERWGRHWLDLVRFAETSGHEFDYDIPGAWRYRDYVVRAFRSDLPYDQFVVEQIAGDLLASPRRSPVDGTNESILGTAIYFLGEGTHSPVDVREEQVRRTSDQIDVISKAFVGLTVACARCHDHKFDAITQRDYYALAGFLESSRHQQAFLDPASKIGSKIADLDALKARMMADFLPTGAGSGISRESLASRNATASLEMPARAWVDAIRNPRAKRPDHPLFPLAATLDGAPDRFEERRRSALDQLGKVEAESSGESILFEGFDGPAFENWTRSGDAFAPRPTRPGDVRIGANEPSPVAPGMAHSGLVSDRLQGVLRSRTFRIDRGTIQILAGGRHGRVNVVVDGFEKNRDPIYGGLIARIDAEESRWYTLDVSMWKGHRAYLELSDGGTLDYSGGNTDFAPGDGFLAVDEIRFSDASPPRRDHPLASAVLGDPRANSAESLVGLFEAEMVRAVEAFREGRPAAGPIDEDRQETLAFLIRSGLIATAKPSPEMLRQYREIESKIPDPSLAPAILDGTGQDSHILIRGNHRTEGEPAARTFVEAIGGSTQATPSSGSGRMELARRVVDPKNPLTARVMVNRIWKHHFGVGLVPTPDDFGNMGQAPSHPELLDWLACRFVESGWSVKSMHRLILLSHAYRMSSKLDPEADRVDPTNRLLHRQNLRRLDAESIRDAMLAISGRLDPKIGGPSVMPHLSPFMEGRGRPGRGGPLDGDGRRSLYINVRRNFLTPMLLAFDFPAPNTCMGRRNVSNVPAQALTLLDDPFVLQQAKLWAEKTLSAPARTPADRVDSMYFAAFGRSPSEAERAESLGFVGDRAEDVQAWADLAHVLLNVKSFLFVE